MPSRIPSNFDQDVRICSCRASVWVELTAWYFKSIEFQTAAAFSYRQRESQLAPILTRIYGQMTFAAFSTFFQARAPRAKADMDPRRLFSGYDEIACGKTFPHSHANRLQFLK